MKKIIFSCESYNQYILHKKMLATGFTDSRLSQLFSGDVEPVLG
jgi:hypothetical protein